jgi:hypothetical protein
MKINATFAIRNSQARLVTQRSLILLSDFVVSLYDNVADCVRITAAHPGPAGNRVELVGKFRIHKRFQHFVFNDNGGNRTSRSSWIVGGDDGHRFTPELRLL